MIVFCCYNLKWRNRLTSEVDNLEMCGDITDPATEFIYVRAAQIFLSKQLMKSVIVFEVQVENHENRI